MMLLILLLSWKALSTLHWNTSGCVNIFCLVFFSLRLTLSHSKVTLFHQQTTYTYCINVRRKVYGRGLLPPIFWFLILCLSLQKKLQSSTPPPNFDASVQPDCWQRCTFVIKRTTHLYLVSSKSVNQVSFQEYWSFARQTKSRL